MPGFASMPTINLPPAIAGPLFGAINRLEIAFNPAISIKRVRRYPFTWHGEGQYLFLAVIALACLYTCESPGLFGKLFIVTAYTLGLLIPFTGQFVLPATPIFSWLLLFWSAKYIPIPVRPHIWVSVLPTLETVLYGASISDILTNVTNPVLDILAWLPYGVIHFAFPFVAAALIWIFGPCASLHAIYRNFVLITCSRPGAVKFFAKVFGYLNFLGVMTQIFFPCAPPCKAFHPLVSNTLSDRFLRRVRAHPRHHACRLYHERLSRRSFPNRYPLPQQWLHKHLHQRSCSFRCLSFPPCRLFNGRCSTSQPLLPAIPSILRSVCSMAVLVNHVPHTSVSRPSSTMSSPTC